MSRISSMLERIRPAQAVALLSVVGVLVHAQSSFVGYMADDYGLLAAATSSSFRVLLDAFPAGRGTYFRPLVILSLRLEHTILPSPVLHHLMNLGAHLGAGALVYAIVLLLVRARAWAFCAALVFLVHPIAAFDVNWISGRTDVVAALFSLGALAAFLLAGRSRTRSWTLVAGAALVLALAAKEVAACVPLAAGALHAFERPSQSAEARRRQRWALMLLAAVTFAWISFLYVRFYRGADAYPTPTAFSVFKGIVALPLGLVWPGSYWTVRHHMLASPAASLLAGAGLVVLGLLAVALVLRRARDRGRVAALACLAMAPLVPFFIGGVTPSTRLMYLPLATTSIAVASGLANVAVPRLLRWLALPALLLMTIASIERGHRWLDNSRRTDAYCAEIQSLRQESPDRRPVFVSMPYELDDVPLYWLHQNGALGACLSGGRSFEPSDALLVGPVVLPRPSSEPVIVVERLSLTDVQLRAVGGALFGFDVTLEPHVPMVFPDLSLMGMDVRHGREVRGFIVSLAEATVENADLLYFDGVSLRRVPPPPR